MVRELFIIDMRLMLINCIGPEAVARLRTAEVLEMQNT